MNNLVEQTSIELQQDIQWLLYLIDDRQSLIKNKKKQLITANADTNQTIYWDSLLEKYKNALIQSSETLHSNTSIDTCNTIFLNNYSLFLNIRACFLEIAAFITSKDWQSPSFLGSTFQEAGTEEGTIHQAINDYKRDQHSSERTYENQFLKEYVQHSFFTPDRIFSTSTGMSALTTICGFLQGEHIFTDSPIFVGKHSYFENKIVLKKMFPTQYREVNEKDVTSLSERIEKERPSAVFFDSLCNESTVLKPDLTSICNNIKLIKDYNPYVIIDNTGLSIHFQPFVSPFPKPKNIIVWESLLKHHQFGMDRIPGGIVYGSCKNAIEIYTYRDHLGTNSTDIQITSIPLPNKSLLKDRLQRHARNNALLTQILQETIHSSKNVSFINSAVLDDPHSYPGAIITITMTDTHQHSAFYNKVLQNMIRTAKRDKVPLIGGTSFGLPITRVYIPASRKGQGHPFFRISIGMEPLLYMQTLAHTMKKTLSDM